MCDMSIHPTDLYISGNTMKMDKLLLLEKREVLYILFRISLSILKACIKNECCVTEISKIDN